MILPVEYPGGSYDIVLERGALARAAEYLPRTGKALIVTDDGVPAAYARPDRLCVSRLDDRGPSARGKNQEFG